MVTEKLREQFTRVRDLTNQLNGFSDEANRVASLLEQYLSETCKVGVSASVFLDGQSHPDDSPFWQEELRYGRFKDGNFRLHTVFTFYDESDPHTGGPSETWTAWQNLSRDTRLKAFELLPELLDKVIVALQDRIGKLHATTASIEALMEFIPPRKGGKK